MRSLKLSCGALMLLIAASGCSVFGRGAGEPREGGEESEHGTAVEAQRAVVHTVRERETLSSISKKYSGSPTHWRQIVDANPGLKPARLRPGDELLIPQPLSASSARGSRGQSDRTQSAGRKGKDADRRAAKSAPKRSGPSTADRSATRSKGASVGSRSDGGASSPTGARAALKTRPPEEAPKVVAAKSSAGVKTATRVNRVQTIKGKSSLHGAQLASRAEAIEASSVETLPNHFFVCYRNRCETKIID